MIIIIKKKTRQDTIVKSLYKLHFGNANWRKTSRDARTDLTRQQCTVLGMVLADFKIVTTYKKIK